MVQSFENIQHKSMNIYHQNTIVTNMAVFMFDRVSTNFYFKSKTQITFNFGFFVFFNILHAFNLL